ncbi:Septin-like protein [Zancudomyces culisetae]|uniref:Septin-like protein n=1 Tax=Zancudomyces culisetae TaxID=1213189 RepID=A0A1R1PII5_ZANCU|nr:Septin-like protein [Zancudomyces culisetae]|eukprot:OMH80662.1 Septin-like protein [Zancudomyces culisetae]
MTLKKVPELIYYPQITCIDLEEKGFKVKLNVVDTPGFGDFVNNRNCWVPVVDFIEGQYEQYLMQEMQPVRSGMVDLRVHVSLYFIRPNGHGLKALDVEAMKAVGRVSNLIPVISKADTLGPSALLEFKKKVMDAISVHNIRIYTPQIESEDEMTAMASKDIVAAYPFAIVGGTQDVIAGDGRVVKGRVYPWGIVEVESDKHSDFKKLRSLLIGGHMLDLINTTQEVHYDVYRTLQLKTRKIGEPKQKTVENKKFREDEERLREEFTKKVKVEEERFRKWEQRLITERDRLNEDLEKDHTLVKKLESEIENFQKNSPSYKYFKK